MPLSVTKLENFLESKGFTVNRYFILDGLCFYIEICSNEDGNVILLYIPSKYEIKMHSGSNVYKISFIDMDSSEETSEEYAGKSDEIDSSDIYGNTNITLSPTKDKNVEDYLKDGYRTTISLSKILLKDTLEIRSMRRQIKRLVYCVENINYKIGIIYKNYICAIRRDNSVDCFMIRNFTRHNCKKLLVISDLEMLYEKGGQITSDIAKVSSGVHNILLKNQSTHRNVIEHMRENEKEIENVIQKIQDKKSVYDDQITRLENILDILAMKEKQLQSELVEISEVQNTGGGQTALHFDIKNIHQKNSIEKELAEIGKIRIKTSSTLYVVRNKLADVILTFDQIAFDNTVMLNRILENFAKIKEYTS